MGVQPQKPRGFLQNLQNKSAPMLFGLETRLGSIQPLLLLYFLFESCCRVSPNPALQTKGPMKKRTPEHKSAFLTGDMSFRSPYQKRASKGAFGVWWSLGTPPSGSTTQQPARSTRLELVAAPQGFPARGGLGRSMLGAWGLWGRTGGNGGLEAPSIVARLFSLGSVATKDMACGCGRPFSHLWDKHFFEGPPQKMRPL